MATLMQLQVDIQRKIFLSFEESGQVVALENVRFAADAGEFLCILGPSGCGKTTLLNIITGLDPHFEGAVSLEASIDTGTCGQDAHDSKKKHSRESELRIGFVFQNPRLLPWRTVEENLRIVLSTEQIQSGIIDELLASAELEAFRNTYPSQLSIGMQRRVSLIRAFSIQPDLLVMDEPFVSLDKRMEDKLHQVLLDYWQTRNPSVLFVTHQINEALKLASRLLVFSSRPGTIILDIPVELSYPDRNTPEVFRAFVTKFSEEYPGIRQIH
jgi:NitT/TauT family transport system ATP-binding protein